MNLNKCRVFTKDRETNPFYIHSAKDQVYVVDLLLLLLGRSRYQDEMMNLKISQLLIRNLKDLAFVASGKLNLNGPTIFDFLLLKSSKLSRNNSLTIKMLARHFFFRDKKRGPLSKHKK